MFKKPEGEYQQPDQPGIAPRTNPAEPRREAATIGPSISIKGDLTGEEDLIIQGRVEGKVDLKQNSITIGKNGRAKADIHGKIVTVEGEVEGNLFAQEQIVIRVSGKVKGDIASPRVSIEDGAKFKGTIDMDGNSSDKNRTGAPGENRIFPPGPSGLEPNPKPGISIRTATGNTRG
jgi:cytoskeletal protein CcmA (bactofilin family)